MVQGSVERYFQLAIECMIDVGEILIANLRLRKPEDSRDVIDILGENKIFPDKFALHLGPITGFRNLLAHDYLEIDREKVYDHLQNDLQDFDKFSKHIAKFIINL